MSLTVQQKRLLDFIEREVRASGVCPSFDEMKAALSLRSKSGIHRLVSALEERGHIHRLHHRARAIYLGPRPAETFPPASIRSFEAYTLACLRAGIDAGLLYDVVWRGAENDRQRRAKVA